jgi:hypothetical protein
MITSFTTGAFKFDSCVPDKVFLTKKQYYLLKGDQLYIANPLDSDTLTQDCPLRTKKEEAIPLPKGLILIDRDPACHLETSQLVVPNTRSSPTALDLGSTLTDLEISQIEKIESSKTFLERGITIDNTPFEKMDDVLEAYHENIGANLRAVDDLSKEVERINSIDTLSNYVPLDLSKYSKSSSSVLSFMDILGYCLIAVGLVVAILFCKAVLPDNCCLLSYQCLRDALKKKPRSKRPSAPPKPSEEDPQQLIELMTYEASLRPSPWIFLKDEMGTLTLSQMINPSLKVDFDFNLNAVIDPEGRKYPKIEPPSSGMTALYLSEVEKTRLPPLTRDSAGLACLQSHPAIKFTATLDWINTLTNKKVWGLRRPQPEDY